MYNYKLKHQYTFIHFHILKNNQKHRESKHGYKIINVTVSNKDVDDGGLK